MLDAIFFQDLTTNVADVCSIASCLDILRILGVIMFLVAEKCCMSYTVMIRMLSTMDTICGDRPVHHIIIVLAFFKHAGCILWVHANQND